MLQAVCRSGHIFYQSCITLGVFIHGINRFADLSDASALLGTRGAGPGHDVGDTFNCADHFTHSVNCITNQIDPLCNRFHVVVDNVLYFLGGGRRALRKIADFACHDRESASLFACSRRFHCRIQGEGIGLKSNAVDHADSVGNFLARVADLLHGLHRL